MNDLTMGPLPAKEKQVGDTIYVRCGVRDCPEMLGNFCRPVSGYSKGWFTLSPGYMWSQSQGCFLRSRRAAHRDTEQRYRIHSRNHEDDFQAFKREAKQNPENARTFLDEQSKENRKVANETRVATHGTWPDVGTEGKPFLVKCGRCGRLCKIETADKKPA